MVSQRVVESVRYRSYLCLFLQVEYVDLFKLSFLYVCELCSGDLHLASLTNRKKNVALFACNDACESSCSSPGPLILCACMMGVALSFLMSCVNDKQLSLILRLFIMTRQVEPFSGPCSQQNWQHIQECQADAFEYVCRTSYKEEICQPPQVVLVIGQVQSR